VNKPSGKKGISNNREALMLVIAQVKILLENLQMVDPSVIFLPHKAKDREGAKYETIATAEHIHDNYEFMRVILISRYPNAIGIPTKSGRRTAARAQT
jgi:hypothetical protein